MTTEEAKHVIDGMSYEALLRKWRFAPVGDPMFVGEVGKYYAETMSKKRQTAGQGQAVAASKVVGWDTP